MRNNLILLVGLASICFADGSSKRNLPRMRLEAWAQQMEKEIPPFPKRLQPRVNGVAYEFGLAEYDSLFSAPKFIVLLNRQGAKRCERIVGDSSYVYRERNCDFEFGGIFNSDSCPSMGVEDVVSERLMLAPFSFKEFDRVWLDDHDVQCYRRNLLRVKVNGIDVRFSYDDKSRLRNEVWNTEIDSIFERTEFFRWKDRQGRDTLIREHSILFRESRWDTCMTAYRWIRYDSLGRMTWQRKGGGDFSDPPIADRWVSYPDVEYLYDKSGLNHLRVHRYPTSKKPIALTSLRYDSIGRLARQTVGYITQDSLLGWISHIEWTFDSLGREVKFQRYLNLPRIDALDDRHFRLDHASPWWRW